MYCASVTTTLSDYHSVYGSQMQGVSPSLYLPLTHTHSPPLPLPARLPPQWWQCFAVKKNSPYLNIVWQK